MTLPKNETGIVTVAHRRYPSWKVLHPALGWTATL